MKKLFIATAMVLFIAPYVSAKDEIDVKELEKTAIFESSDTDFSVGKIPEEYWECEEYRVRCPCYAFKCEAKYKGVKYSCNVIFSSFTGELDQNASSCREGV